MSQSCLSTVAKEETTRIGKRLKVGNAGEGGLRES